MSFKLTKEQRERRDELVEAFHEASSGLETAIAEYNAKLEEMKAPVEAALAKYNEVGNDAREFADEISGWAGGEIQERSERWQESERGQAAQSWCDEWSNLTFDEVTIDLPEEITLDDPDYGAALDGAPEEIEA